MASFFFDTSAIAKRYIKESGSAWVSDICEEARSDLIFVADITEVELVSALFRRCKGGSITKAEAKAALVQFDNDLSNQYIVLGFSFELISNARRLVESYALRGYDAVQLAAAIECNKERIFLGSAPITFVSSDQELIDAGESEGLLTENPNNYS